MRAHEIAGYFQKSRRKTFKNGDEGFVASCPCPKHKSGDKSLSLAFGEGENGWIWLKCQGGCSKEEILSAAGLKNEDLKAEDSRPNQPEAIYEYTDKEGKYLFEKRRFRISARDKTFKLYSRDEKGKTLYTVSHLNGWAGTLFNWPSVEDAIKKGQTVYVNEGEKGALSFIQRGLCGTCQPVGGGPDKWLKSHTEALAGAHVVIVADRDDVGKDYAARVAQSLKGVALSVKTVQSATADIEKSDAYDHFSKGFGIEDFIELKPEEIKVRKAGLRSFADIEEDTVEWLCYPYFPKGATSILAGDPGIGKSTFAYALASMVTNGKGAFYPEQDPGDVLLYCLEDDSRKIIKKRLRENEANMSRVHDGKFDEKDNPEGIEPPITLEKMQLIREAASQLPSVKLILFDPVSEWFPADKSMNQSNESREINKLFRRLAEETGACVLLLGHPNKQSGASLMYRLSGSIDFSAIVRSGLYAAKVPDSEECAIVHFKANWGPRGRSIGYRIDDEGLISFTGASDVTEEMLRQPDIAEKPVTASEREECKAWILETLKHGKVASKVIFAGADAEGYSDKTVKRAKKELPQVRAYQDGRAWWWELSTDAKYYWNKDYDPWQE